MDPKYSMTDERIVFYVDDMSTESYRDSSFDFQQDQVYHGLYPPGPNDGQHLSNSVCSQFERSKRSRQFLDAEPSTRRSSIHSNRSRANSCSRPTPLGDGRRASISRKGKPRRASTAQRKNSIRPTRISSKEPRKPTKSPAEIERALRHRRIAMIILGIFVFLLIASVLVVVVTLTHSSFLSPATGSPELAKHRAQLRKENEELLNSLNRDSSLPENTTAPP